MFVYSFKIIMSYKHKSGAQKRKEKEDRENESKKGQLFLGQYFKSSISPTKLPKWPTSTTSAVSVPSELEGNSNNVIIVDSNNPTLSKVIQINENAITETDVTEKLDSTPQLQTLCKYFDIGDPNFVISRDLKYPHIPNPESFPVDSDGFNVPI
jgi:hypothetical protein